LVGLHLPILIDCLDTFLLTDYYLHVYSGSFEMIMLSNPLMLIDSEAIAQIAFFHSVRNVQIGGKTLERFINPAYHRTMATLFVPRWITRSQQRYNLLPYLNSCSDKQKDQRLENSSND
jgi:hypothetical protein